MRRTEPRLTAALVGPDEGYGGPAQPSPTIAQCLNGGLAWLEIECNRCKTRAEPAAQRHLRPERKCRPITQKETVIGGPGRTRTCN